MTIARRRSSVPVALALLVALAIAHHPTARADSAASSGAVATHGVSGASRSSKAAPPRSSAFAPRHAHNHHVYGAPIQPPILKRRTHPKPHAAAPA